jgi:cation diffusion facilitator CzcD-associated flavoprotein CzcO
MRQQHGRDTNDRYRGWTGPVVNQLLFTQAGHEHLVLERASRAGSVWRNDRWDSFTFLTPNWSIKLPGMSWLYKHKSPLLMGVGEDADYSASHITE